MAVFLWIPVNLYSEGIAKLIPGLVNLFRRHLVGFEQISRCQMYTKQPIQGTALNFSVLLERLRLSNSGRLLASSLYNMPGWRANC